MAPLRCLVAAALLAAGPAFAAETGGCGAFKWPVEQEVRLLTDPSLRDMESGGNVEPSKLVGVRLVLGPAESAAFAVPPERAPKPGAFGGVLTWRAAAEGEVQVTLSDPAWIDLVQDGRALKPEDFSGVSDCAGVRKTMRFRVSPGPVTLQVSGARGDRIGVAVAPAR